MQNKALHFAFRKYVLVFVVENIGFEPMTPTLPA
jgi:hypothetical protein